MKQKKFIFTLLLVVFLVLGCSEQNFFAPDQTATPIPTSTPIVFPTSSPSPTRDPLSDYLSLVPEIPSNFSWKIIPDKNLAVVIPDGWFFKEENHPELDIDGVYVTKEDIEVSGRFSTGLTVLIFKNFSSNDVADQFAQKMMMQYESMDTTKEILKTWDHESGASVVHHLRIRAEYPNETDMNKNKIVHYSASIANNSVYWAVFESPESLWEETVNDYGLVLDYIVVFIK